MPVPPMYDANKKKAVGVLSNDFFWQSDKKNGGILIIKKYVLKQAVTV